MMKRDVWIGMGGLLGFIGIVELNPRIIHMNGLGIDRHDALTNRDPDNLYYKTSHSSPRLHPEQPPQHQPYARQPAVLTPSRRPLRHPALLLLPLLLEILLLRLGVEGVELGIPLRLLGLLLLDLELLGLFVLGLLLDGLDVLVADDAQLAGDLGAEVGLVDEDVGDVEEVAEDGDQAGVVVVGREAVLEEDALAGVGLVEAG